jgi:DNA-binding CsgD family transcriptional regulator
MRLTLNELRQVLHLHTELNEFSPCSPAWRCHLVESVARLIPCRFANLAEVDRFAPDQEFRIICFTPWALDEPIGEAFHQWSLCGRTTSAHPMLEGMTRLPQPVVTRRRIEICEDEVWYSSECYEYMHDIAHLDDQLVSHLHLTPGSLVGWGVGLAVARETKDKLFTSRERALLDLLHGELRPIYQRILNPNGGPRPLPARLRQVLDRILAGDGDKQIARRLNLSPHTVREYICELHRRFDASNRSELILRCTAPQGLDRPGPDQPNGSAKRL